MTTEDGWELPIGLTAEYAIDLLSPASYSIPEAAKAATTDRNGRDPDEDDGDSQMKRKRDDDTDDSTHVSQDNIKAKNANPFAAYAFDASSSSPASSRRSVKRKDMSNDEPSTSHETNQHRKQHDDKMGVVDTKQLIAKWHAFADPNTSVEQQRFQILVAARLHARCQANVVSKTMDRLRSFFNESFPYKGGGLTVHSLAGADPQSDIAPLLSSILFGNVKANQIVQAARDVRSKFGGEVPESKCSLTDITGIGPKLAEVLAVVNRRSTFSA